MSRSDEVRTKPDVKDGVFARLRRARYTWREKQGDEKEMRKSQQDNASVMTKEREVGVCEVAGTVRQILAVKQGCFIGLARRKWMWPVMVTPLGVLLSLPPPRHFF